MLESNNLVTSRLELMNDTLDDLRGSAESVSSNLMTVIANGSNADAVTGSLVAAKGALGSMIGSLNVNITGQYLFAGAQTDQLPMTDASDVVAAQFKDFLTAAGRTPETVTKDELNQYFSQTGFTAGGQTYRFDDMFADNADHGEAELERLVDRIRHARRLAHLEDRDDRVLAQHPRRLRSARSRRPTR